MDIDPAWLDTDLYAVLGVDVDASAAELTKAYRRLARELHPDTGSDPAAQNRFTSVSAAYEVLRDPDKRAAYDQARRLSSTGARRRPGGGYTIRVENVGDPGDISIRDRSRSVFDDVFDVSPRRRSTRRRVHLRSRPGDDVQTEVAAHVETHGHFGRAGDDLTLTVPVTYAEAALGADVTVPTPDGEPVTVRIPPGTPTGRILRIRGRGTPTSSGRGDLLVTVHVDVPRNLSDRQRELIRELAEHDPDDLRAHLET